MYKFYLGDILLPVAPSDITVTQKNNNTVVKLINEEELNILQKSGLTDYSFKAILPVTNYYFSDYETTGFNDAYYYLDKFVALKNDKNVFDFIVIENKTSAVIISDTVSIEGLNWNISADENGDVIMNISLKSYVYHSTKTIVITDNVVETESDRAPSNENVLDEDSEEYFSYTIKSGDTLIGIALRYYSEESMYLEIYSLNKDVLDAEAKSRGFGSENGDWWIFPGTEILLPAY